MKEKRFTKWPYIIGLIGLGVLVLILSYYHIPKTKDLVNTFTDFDCEAKYQYINAKVACGPPPVIAKVGYAETQAELNKYIESKIAEGHLIEAGLYFRDLENGPVFGVNESLDFAAASLLKLPVALAYLSAVIDQPEVLDKTLSYQTTSINVEQFYPPKETIQPNTPYTIKELIRRMLVYSDNNSYILLLDFLEQSGKLDLLQQTYVDLGLATPDTAFDETLTVRRYGSIFRALYNVSYLDSELDEQILEWLVESDFNVGIRAGVPDSVKIANKFGERIADDGKTKQLHDCGIIYYPKNPYLLCIMTRGDDYNELSKIIGEMSKIVYQEVDSRKINQ